MYDATKIDQKTDWELILVFGGWITCEILILSVCMISMS